MSYVIKETDSILQDRNSLAVFIAKLYIVCLTYKMIAPLNFLESIIGAAAISFDLIPHVLGLLLVIIENKGMLSLDMSDEGSLLTYFFKMTIWFNISSFIMAVFMQSIYGSLGNENAFHGIIGMILYWTQYAFIMFYNYHVFKILTITEIENALKLELLILMSIGYFQMVVMLAGGSVGVIYDRLDILNVLNNANQLPKLPLTGMEGAYAGYIMGTLVFPFLYALDLSGRAKGGVLFYVLPWLPLVYMTFSSAAYILFIVITLGYAYFYIKTRGFSRSIITVLAIFLAVAFLIVLFGNDILHLLPDTVSSNIRYLLFEKIQDTENGSTAMRSVPLHYNLGAFIEYPFLGVGNGLQGYFLEKYYPASMSTAKGVNGTLWLNKWTSGISNGALFWPSILSGYGIVGVIIVLNYILKSERLLRTKSEELGTMYYMYRLSMIGIIVEGFATDFVAKYYVWFAISIPLISVIYKEKSGELDPTLKAMRNYKYIRF